MTRFKRAPRKARRRRNRKFAGRPTSHDGLSVIARYGNWAGWTAEGAVAGRVGNSVIVCADGYELSVAAGHLAHCLPRVNEHVGPDYRGPYSHVEFIAWSEPVYELDAEPGEPVESVHVEAVRAVIELHGGFKRMQQNPRVKIVRADAVVTAQQRAEYDRRYPQRKWPQRGQWGGEVETITVPASDAMREFAAELGERAEKVRNGQPADAESDREAL